MQVKARFTPDLSGLCDYNPPYAEPVQASVNPLPRNTWWGTLSPSLTFSLPSLPFLRRYRASKQSDSCFYFISFTLIVDTVKQLQPIA